MDPGPELYQNVMEGQQKFGIWRYRQERVWCWRLRILSWNRKEMKTDRRKSREQRLEAPIRSKNRYEGSN